MHAEQRLQLRLDVVDGPLAGVHLDGAVVHHGGDDALFDEIKDQLAHGSADVLDLVLPLAIRVGLEDVAAQAVDRLALLVHDVVVLEHVLAAVEVHALDAFLRVRDRLRHHLVLDGDAVLHPKHLHHADHLLAAEDAHEVVFEAEEEPAGARVALPAGAPPQLVVDAP